MPRCQACDVSSQFLSCFCARSVAEYLTAPAFGTSAPKLSRDPLLLSSPPAVVSRSRGTSKLCSKIGDGLLFAESFTFWTFRVKAQDFSSLWAAFVQECTFRLCGAKCRTTLLFAKSVTLTTFGAKAQNVSFSANSLIF